MRHVILRVRLRATVSAFGAPSPVPLAGLARANRRIIFNLYAHLFHFRTLFGQDRLAFSGAIRA
jgi:hypothetical protein